MSPMLFDMSVDGSPIVVFMQHSSRLPSGKVVHRKFLVRNQFVHFAIRSYGNACCLSSTAPCF